MEIFRSLFQFRNNIQTSQRKEFLLSHTPALLQVRYGSVADVTAVHSAGEADGGHALIGGVQGALKGWPDGGDGEDTAAAGDHAPLRQGGAGVEDLQARVLDLVETWRDETFRVGIAIQIFKNVILMSLKWV